MRSCIASTGKPRLGYWHDAGLGEAAGVDPQQAERPVRLPSAVRGRAWVEDPQVTGGLVERYVRMPEHHEIRAGEPAAHPHDTTGGGPAVVHHRHAETVQVQLRGLASPPSGHVRAVVVAEHGDQGRVFRQLGEHRRDADVTGVQDKVRVAQVRGHPGRANPPAPGRMSISQNDNPHSTILPGRGWGGASISRWLFHVPGVVLVDGRDEGGERLAGLGRRRALLVLGFRYGRGGDEPAVGLSTATNTLAYLERAIDGEQQADKQDNSDSEEKHGHLPSHRLGNGPIPSKAGADRIFQTVLMPLTRASAALWLLRCSLRRPSAPGARGEVGHPVERAGWPDFRPNTDMPGRSRAANGRSRPSSQLGPRMVAPAATLRSRSSRSAVTTMRCPGMSRTTATIVSSPDPRARTTRTSPAGASLAAASLVEAAAEEAAAEEMREAAALAAPSSTMTKSGGSVSPGGTARPEAARRTRSA